MNVTNPMTVGFVLIVDLVQISIRRCPAPAGRSSGSIWCGINHPPIEIAETFFHKRRLKVTESLHL